MKVVSKSEAHVIKISEGCTSYEYDTQNKKINIAYIEISGRYPKDGFAVNKECTEMCYVIDGSGVLIVNDKKHRLEKGTVILIDPNEEYYYEGNFKLCVPCTPAWTIEQHKNIN